MIQSLTWYTGRWRAAAAAGGIDLLNPDVHKALQRALDCGIASAWDVQDLADFLLVRDPNKG